MKVGVAAWVRYDGRVRVEGFSKIHVDARELVLGKQVAYMRWVKRYADRDGASRLQDFKASRFQGEERKE